jgi:hypothetical protein
MSHWQHLVASKASLILYFRATQSYMRNEFRPIDLMENYSALWGKTVLQIAQDIIVYNNYL